MASFASEFSPYIRMSQETLNVDVVNTHRPWYTNKTILTILTGVGLAVVFVILVVALGVILGTRNSGNQPTPMTTMIMMQNSSWTFSTPNSSITSSGTPLLPFNGSNGTVLNWAGYQWNVRNNPDAIFGNESFSSNNVWVDSVGYLHLKLSYDSTKNQWWCAELSSQTNFSFGVLLFYVDGQIDQLDPNVVFSIFTYNEVTVRPEIVMEFSTFDQQDSGTPNLWYQVFPDNVNMDTVTAYGQITLNGTYTTQRMDWKTDSLILQSQYNFTQNPNSQVFCQFILDTSRLLSVPQQASPVHLSVWLDGNAPTDGQEVEIIVQNFFYTSY
jgi:hypothetical protein